MSATAQEVVAFVQAQLPGQQRFFGAKVVDEVPAHVASTSTSTSTSVAGFRAGGWGRPPRPFRFAAETIEPLALVG